MVKIHILYMYHFNSGFVKILNPGVRANPVPAANQTYSQSAIQHGKEEKKKNLRKLLLKSGDKVLVKAAGSVGIPVTIKKGK